MRYMTTDAEIEQLLWMARHDDLHKEAAERLEELIPLLLAAFALAEADAAEHEAAHRALGPAGFEETMRLCKAIIDAAAAYRAARAALGEATP